MDARTFRSLPLVLACGIAGVAFAILFVLLAVADAGASPTEGSATELYLIALVLGLALLRATRLRVRVDEGGVVAFTLLRTRRFRWDELVGAGADARGLLLLPIEGAPVLVQSLGHGPLTRRLGADVAGTRAAVLIGAEVARRTGPGDERG